MTRPTEKVQRLCWGRQHDLEQRASLGRVGGDNGTAVCFDDRAFDGLPESMATSTRARAASVR